MTNFTDEFNDTHAPKTFADPLALSVSLPPSHPSLFLLSVCLSLSLALSLSAPAGLPKLCTRKLIRTCTHTVDSHSLSLSLTHTHARIRSFAHSLPQPCLPARLPTHPPTQELKCVLEHKRVLEYWLTSTPAHPSVSFSVCQGT